MKKILKMLLILVIILLLSGCNLIIPKKGRLPATTFYFDTFQELEAHYKSDNVIPYPYTYIYYTDLMNFSEKIDNGSYLIFTKRDNADFDAIFVDDVGLIFSVTGIDGLEGIIIQSSQGYLTEERIEGLKWMKPESVSSNFGWFFEDWPIHNDYQPESFTKDIISIRRNELVNIYRPVPSDEYIFIDFHVSFCYSKEQSEEAQQFELEVLEYILNNLNVMDD